MGDSKFFELLDSKNVIKSRKFINNNINSEKSLIEVLNTLILFSVSVLRKNNDQIHPIILINGVKNIIGDNRKSPSKVLLNFSIDYLKSFELRTDDDKTIDLVLKEGPRESEFISDLHDACQEGDLKKIKNISARIFVVSERSRAVLDALVEVILQNVESSILFAYHLLRSFQFQYSKNVWTFICSIIQEMEFISLPKPHGSSGLSPFDIKRKMILSGDINLFSSAERLWSGDYVRIRSYQRELSHWIFLVSRRDQKKYHKNLPKFSFKDKKNNFFIDIAESIILDNSKSTQTKAMHLVNLESIRAMKKTSNPDQLKLLENYFSGIIENENWGI